MWVGYVVERERERKSVCVCGRECGREWELEREYECTRGTALKRGV